MKVFGNILGNILGIALALSLTAALGYYGYFAAKRFVVLFARLDFPVAMVTATACMALLLAALIIAGSIRRAAQHNAEAHRRVEKAEAYKLFIGLWEEMLRPGQTAESIVQLSRQMQDVNHLLILQGSPTLLKAHVAMQSVNLQEARGQFAEALLAIRKELGLESRGIEAKDLAQLLLSESDKAHGRPSPRQDAQPRVSLAPN